ncbi:gephyrin-like molybdotransferase Glp [Chroococcidiopsis sp. TS-821]|uniref:molybdopterin molybdotransferase MoeA n=1 Tax=Chroococcidiopsis sp. TS-821 TaxID=1378066 RepID=UPI000CED8DD0|nr:gephyrin-like molybdotransferase Glp [Chroococcidiopsis sp. TS-821]PPS40247.1 molybdopterin molybdenumtransferase [Chroococcidiopsis sp. TS-821]
MLPASQAEAMILDLVQPLDGKRHGEVVTLLTAIDRILAAPVVSQLDFPHWDNSAMDGYAVRYEDVKNSHAEQPVALEIVEEIRAGQAPKREIKPGQAARIFTGGVMPSGADTVVMQEHARQEGNRVMILAAPPEEKAFVRQGASYYQAGTPLLLPGIALQPPELAVLAAAQCTQIKVYRRPRVAILSTGDELITPDQPLQLGQIVDSNQYALAALVAQTGAEPLHLGIFPDKPHVLRRAISQAIATADVVLSSGGVSVGDYDFVEQILAELGATIHIRAVAVKPGKPLTFATFSASAATKHKPVLYFGLPGNPVSALVSFWRFVQPALRKLSGLAHSWGPMFVQARSQHDLKSDGQRETYLWGQLHLIDCAYEFHLAEGSHSSGNLINLAQTNGLAVIPVGQSAIAKGETVRVLQVGTPIIPLKHSKQD